MSAGNRLSLEVETKDKHSPTSYPLGYSKESEDKALARRRSLATLTQLCKEICPGEHVAANSVRELSDPRLWLYPAFRASLPVTRVHHGVHHSSPIWAQSQGT